MSDLGWQVEKGACEFKIGIPPLSDEEKNVISSLSQRYSEWSKTHECNSEEDAKKATISLLSSVLEEEGLEADDDQKEYLESIALSHLWGFSLLDPLLADEKIEEIACIGLGKPLYVFIRAGGWKKTDGSFTTPEYFIHLVNKIARPLGRRLSAQTPRLNAVLPDGSRIHASMPPLSNFELTVRKFTPLPFSPCDIIRTKTSPSEAMAFLWLAMQSDSSILVAGNTASGKTTLLGALLSFIPVNERILVIEETPEIRMVQPHRLTLLSNEELSIGMGDLVRDSLRMRPDRVVMGEVRSREECAAWMESVLSGQARGAYGTFHAQSAFEAVRRLKASGVDETDLAAVDYFIIQRRLALYDAKKRKISEVRRMTGIFTRGAKPGEPTPIFEYSRKTGGLEKTAAAKSASLALAAKLGLSPSQFSIEWKKRTNFLNSLCKKRISFEEECNRLQEFAYG